MAKSFKRGLTRSFWPTKGVCIASCTTASSLRSQAGQAAPARGCQAPISRHKFFRSPNQSRLRSPLVLSMIARPPKPEVPIARRLKKLEAAYLRPYRWHIATALAAMLAQSLLLLPLPWLQGWVIDRLAQLTQREAAPGG